MKVQILAVAGSNIHPKHVGATVPVDMFDSTGFLVRLDADAVAWIPKDNVVIVDGDISEVQRLHGAQLRK